MQFCIHYSLHLVFPLFIALLFYKKNWKRTYCILLLTMLVDLDHLFATPIFQANRCSIGFHPLHSYYAIAVYFVLLFFKNPLRIIGIGLLFHMFTDLVDCLISFHKNPSAYINSNAYNLLKCISNCLH